MKGSQTVAVTTTTRVFRRIYRDGEVRVYGCRYATGTRRRIAYAPVNSILRLRHVRISGHHVAFAASLGYKAERPGHFVKVVDLRDGGSRRFYPQHEQPSDVELTSSGEIAWIEAVGEERSVRRSARSSSESPFGLILDTGPAIDPTSLAASGDTVYWTNNGSPRSQALP